MVANALLEPFFVGPGGRRMSQDEIARERKLAEALGVIDTSPVGHWTQGLARVVNAAAGAYRGHRANRAERENADASRDRMGRLISSLGFGGTSGAPPLTGGSTAVPSPASDYASQRVAQAHLPTGERAAYLRSGLVSRGLPEHVADAFLMNFQDESGLDPGINERNPIVPGSRGGFGLYQLTGPRRRAYEAFAQQRGVDPSDVDAQLDFMMTELQGPEAKAAQNILSAPDTGTAAVAIVNDFLRPAKSHRLSRANKYMSFQGEAANGAVDAFAGGELPSADAPDANPSTPVASSLTGHMVNPDIPMAGGTSGFAQPSPQVAQALLGNQQTGGATASGIQPPADPQVRARLIAEIISDPYASEMERRLGMSLLQQQMQRQDPMRQLQMRALEQQLSQGQSLVNAGGGNLYNPNTGEWITAPSAGAPNIPDSFQALQLRAEAAGLKPGTPEYQQFMAAGGRSTEDGAAVQRIDRMAENLMATGDFMDPQEAQNIAVGIVDGRLKADRHPITGELQVVDMATGKPVYGRRMQEQAGPSPMLPAPDTPMTGAEQFGHQFPASNEAFGVPGALAGGINRVTDAIGVGPAYPDIQQTQADFGVLRESLLNDIASAYGRQPPSWLLKEIRDLTPAAGSPFEGASAAQSKMNAIGRHLSTELAATEQALQRELSPQNRQELEARRAGLQMGVSRVEGALQSFGEQKDSPDASQIGEGQTATNPQTGQRIIYRGGRWEPMQ